MQFDDKIRVPPLVAAEKVLVGREDSPPIDR
jgi:hypothetical protein